MDRRLGEREGNRRGAAQAAPSVPRHSPAPDSSRAVPAGRARALAPHGRREAALPLPITATAPSAAAPCGCPRPPVASWRAPDTRRSPSPRRPGSQPGSRRASRHHHRTLAGAALRCASPRLASPQPAAPPASAARRSPHPPRHWPRRVPSAAHWLPPRVNHLQAKGAILAQRRGGGSEGRRSSQALFSRLHLNLFSDWSKLLRRRGSL